MRAVVAPLGRAIVASGLGLWLATSCAREHDETEDWRAAVSEAQQRRLASDPAMSAPPRDIVHAPSSLEGLPSGRTDVHGQEIAIACTTCHGIAALDTPVPRVGETPGGPHAALVAEHGDRPCTACHDPADASRLRLADGTSLPMTEAMQLCAQCHGAQHRAFVHGAHGGMRGHWDAERGPRVRNHCVDCHDPHRPAFPMVQPMPPSRDRFRPASGDHHAAEAAAESDGGEGDSDVAHD